MNGWQKAFWISVGACIVGYVLDALSGEVDASSLWGMLYGTVATVFMVGSALYAVRRRTARHRMGQARNWQQFHVYGGTLFMLLTLMDSKEKIPVAGHVVWITPSGAQSNRTAGIGIQFSEKDSGVARSKIETILAAALNSDRPTHTM